jgi:hypothetical protein
MILPDELNVDLTDILGRPNFACGPIAQVLRKGGMAIPTHAEEEQAHVLFWLLGLYVAHGSDWRGEADRRLRTIIEDAKKAG